MRWLALLLVLSAWAGGASGEAEKIAALLRKIPRGTIGQRVDDFSRRFLGAKYVDNPLGEGPGAKYDRRPLFRTDAFDCTTFVETTMALALSHSLAEFERTLQRIRYQGGKIDFTHRNHFPDADWIAHNSAAGFVTDITAEVAGATGVLTATAAIDKKGWYENLGPKSIERPDLSAEKAQALLYELHAEGKRYSRQSYSIPYIALDKIVTRREVPAEEIAKRKAEEEAIVEKYKGRQPLSENVEKEEHDELVKLRQEHVLAEAEVDTALIGRIPHATILNIVRPNWKIPGTHLNISHQGIVIHKPGLGVFFRHTSRSGGERAKDVPLANYLKLCLLSPPIKGINLLRINERP